MSDDDPPIVVEFPLITAPDGRAYIGCDHVVTLLRALAWACRNTGELDPEVLAECMAAVIDAEADTLDCRAVAHTA